MNTKLLAQKIWESGDLFRGEEYSFKDLCRMRDALYMLDVYGFADLDLLKEVEKWIEQKTSE